MRIFSLMVLLWGWGYFAVRHFSPPLKISDVDLSNEAAILINAMLAIWILSSTASKFFVLLNIFEKRWSALSAWSFFSWLAYLIVFFLSGPKEPFLKFFWYHQIFAFGLFLVWPIFDTALCFGTRHFDGLDEPSDPQN